MLSTFVGFAIGESTDVGHTSQMIIYVFYVDVQNDYTFECEFFALIEVLGPSAEQLYESMRERICAVKDTRGTPWLWNKWMTFGTDGPTVMTSPEKGVWGLVKAVKPCMFAHHCIGHRAHLGARDCMEDVPFCNNLVEFLRALGKFYSWSTERRVDLKAITMDNDDPQTQVDMSCATRWLSRDGAALSVLDKYESIVEQHYRGKDENSTSLGLYNKLTDYRYFAGLAHVSDILSKWAAVSRTFQKKIIDGYTVDTTVEKFVAGMEKFVRGDDDDFPFFGPRLTELVEQMKYDDDADFTYGGAEAGGFKVKFGAQKRTFIEKFAQDLAGKAKTRMTERFPLNKLLRAFDIFDRRRFSSDKNYGNTQCKELAVFYAMLLQVAPSVVVAAWADFRSDLEKRPETETWQQTYRHFKAKWAASEDGGHMELLMDIKAVIVFASVCCERGFSHMKEAKTERQAAMESKTLDVRLRIQLLAPKDPRLTMARSVGDAPFDWAAYRKAITRYNSAISALINAAITRWGPAKHQKAAVVVKALNGRNKRGVLHKKTIAKPSEGDVFEFLLGNASGPVVIKRKAGTIAGGGSLAPNGEIPPPPALEIIEDAITVAPKPDLASVDPPSLRGLMFAQLFKIVVDNGVFLDWEWHSAKVKKASRRPRDSHLIIEVKFAGESGARSIDLSDGKQYTPTPSADMDVAWVLLVEVRDGAKARKKLKKKRKATSEEHDSDDSGGGGGGDGEDETAGGGGGGAAKPAKKKKGKHAKKK